jgi:cellulose synthase/poly-beta-1,6-N-acetylglucosamine synthase-like glycosyltransferase
MLVAYTYVFYPAFLFIGYAFSQVRRDWRYLTGRHNRRASASAPEKLPTVSLIIPAYNEEAHLWGKVANIQQLDYPREKLEVIFVSDGATDRTNAILQAIQEPNIKAIFLPVRKGKANALNHAVSRACHEILIFSDAATQFAPEALKNLVRHFSDPMVGGVCGALQFQRTIESQHTEGLYWHYESMLRLMEGRLGATLTASGAIYALRRECYRPLGADTVIEDFLIPMNARTQGFRVLYDPEAVATDFAAGSVAGEFSRRVRLAVGSFQALGELMRVPLSGFTMVAFISHKLLRWLVPFLLIGVLVSNAFLWRSPFYRLTFIAQLLFYLWAGLGFLLRQRLQRARFALVGYFLLAMNLAFLVGFVRSLVGRQEVKWHRVN